MFIEPHLGTMGVITVVALGAGMLVQAANAASLWDGFNLIDASTHTGPSNGKMYGVRKPMPKTIRLAPVGAMTGETL